MIAASNRAGQPERWQEALRDAVTDPAELIAMLGLDPGLVEPARRAAARLPLRVPRGFVARMRHGDPGDPLLRQVLPLGAKLAETPGFVADPVDDLSSAAAPGVLHKYEGRALLKGVNDSADIPGELAERLFDTAVLPYYLHLLDRVRGAAHFEVPEGEARVIPETLRRRLPGYLVPRLACEEAGMQSKTPVA